MLVINRKRGERFRCSHGGVSVWVTIRHVDSARVRLSVGTERAILWPGHRHGFDVGGSPASVLVIDVDRNKVKLGIEGLCRVDREEIIGRTR